MNNIHWKHFLALDSDLLKIQRYVEFDESNFNTFSIEFVKLLLSIGSEIDVVCKLLCHEISPNKKVNNIAEYRGVIIAEFPKFSTISVNVPLMSIQLMPWDDWKNNKNPRWWKSYNDVKHNRDSCYSDANLENTLNALSGLLGILLYYYRTISTKLFHDYPNVLNMKGWPGQVMLGGHAKLPDF